MKDLSDKLKVVVIGGGAAGMSCALWLKQLGLAPVIIDQNPQLGGQLLQINRINRWVLGNYKNTSVELADLYAGHIAKEAITVLNQTKIVSVSKNTDGFKLAVQKNNKTHLLNAKGVIIATGVRLLGETLFQDVPGFDEAMASSLISFYPLDHLDKLDALKQHTIAVIGGGNNAYYTALDAAKAGIQVKLLIRSKPKARKIVQQEADAFIENGLISIATGIRIDAFKSETQKIKLAYSDGSGSAFSIDVTRLFVRAGFAPNTDFLENYEALAGIALDNGYIKTDVAKRTSEPWIYAIGDVANAKHQSVAGAIADGAIAAQDLSDRL